MSYCVQQIVQLAGEIYSGIGAPSSLSVGYVSGWLVSSGSLGGINNRLTTCFSLTGDSPCIVGGFGASESAIYELMFRTDYFLQQANAVLANGGTQAWLTMKEGDTTISRESTAARAKVYLEIYRETEDDLRVATANWKLGHSIPASVDGSSLYSWPSP